MTSKELDYIIQEGESYLVEFKERVGASLAREITAFANASGGRIFIGIADNGSVIGVKTDNKIRSQIQDIANNCHPPVQVSIDFIENIAIVHVPEGKDKPYQCSDGFFSRMGPNSQKMTRDEIADFLQAEGKLRFEEQFHKTFDFARHYDPQRLNAFLKTAGIGREIDDEIILENLGVAERIEDRLRMKNVGVLFFSRSIETLCEQATITCAVFDGTERIHVINRKDYQEDVITNIDYVMHFIKQELRVRYEMTGRPQREEIYEIPLDAIREAVVNAVSHRDYFQYGAHTTVEVFDDRIEISNPGGLPKGLPPEEFGKRAMRRNQIIASLLQRVRLVENMGTGINKIRRLLQEAKCADPRFDFGSFFTIVFPRAEKKVGAGLKPGGTTQETTQETDRTTQETGMATEEAILLLLREDPSITQKKMASRVGLTPDGVKFNINKLKEKGIIRREGPTKKGRWVIINRK
ncbi:MAG TPA: hypothetical protein DCZ97_03005 [Syntrophus sp. (in: bacteria)]|nr:MAG: hypothetical protein A2X92_08160 [Syntrophus sp. GWC2_56_31]HBB15998.1 hypothetical protein [Syntrophus sp. (in: bacteria)]